MKLFGKSLSAPQFDAHFIQRQRFFGQAAMVTLVLFSCFTMAAWPTASLTAGSLNEYCPVTTDERIDPAIYVVYQGKQIAFCCNKCRRQFLENPDKYMERITALQTDSTQEHYHETDTTKGDGTTGETGLVRSMIGSGQSTEDHQEHNHETGHANPNRLIAFLGKFHPVIVHFPVALVISALLISLLGLTLHSEWVEIVSVKITYLAVLFAVLAVPLGFAAATGAHYPEMLKYYFLWHRITGISSGVLTIAAAIAARRLEQYPTTANRRIFRIVLIACGVIVAITGHLGATLVYGPDHFSF